MTKKVGVIADSSSAAGSSKRCATAVSRATDFSLVTGDELHADTAVVVVGRVVLALVGTRTSRHDA